MRNLGEFYRAFEDRFRGPPDVIRERLAVYVPLIRAAAKLNPDAGVVDLGCGRGEWLSLLRDENVLARGIDLDAGMLRDCISQGLDVTQGDALEFLASLPDASQAAVSAFHLVEHIPLESVHVLFDHARRVIRPGGVLILETPNPESLLVSTTEFLLDPSHDRPIPPKLLAFMAEFHGFTKVHLLRLQEPARANTNSPSLWHVLSGISPDYAVVAFTDSQSEASEEAIAGVLADAGGATLYGLSHEFDGQLGEELGRFRHEIRVAKEKLAQTVELPLESTRELAREAHWRAESVHAELDGIRDNQAQLADAQARLADAQARLADAHAHIIAMRASRSWRITAPLRWVMGLTRGGTSDAAAAKGASFANPPSDPVKASREGAMLPARAQRIARELSSGAAQRPDGS